MDKENIEAKKIAKKLRTIANMVEQGYLLHDEQKEIIDCLTEDILVIDFNRASETEFEKIDFYVQEEKDIKKEIESIERLKKQKIIVMFDDKDKVINMSLYEFIKLNRSVSFCVCNVTNKDFNIMENQIKKAKMLDERYSRTTKCDYDMFNYLLFNDTDNEIIRVADMTNEQIKGSYYIDGENDIIYDSNMCRFDKDVTLRKGYSLKIYTMETFDDILKFFKVKDKTENITFSSNQKVLKLNRVSIEDEKK